ncbi:MULTISPECIES: tetratricopeptide repeat protein [Flavobacterium]|uniref:Tetratricopeptide repeat protein n=1 Tax=Flavobacterium sedimenticola TaxID=3043286 RepID=A0ABT6XMW7_9FLAO|nr:tetratricopeptide repeat protein [Flavobacterium sedimenticola]MDI9256024.1 tetratricopeptide repeat protein [Flavobacterium sedimenticola]
MKTLFTYTLILLSFWAQAQKKEKDKNLPQGNEAFAEKKYAEAEAEYRISESKNPKKSIASYNLGNAVYRQNQATEAKYHFATAAKNAKTKQEKHRAFHNLGNTLMKDKDYANAVEAYKNALRNNPADEETRYNFALAKKFLKDNPPKKNDDKSKDKKKQKEDQKENKKNQDQKDKDKDKNQGKNDSKEGKDKDKGKPQPQPGGISKQRLENLLDAVNNEERKVQDKVNKKKVLTSPKKTEKDW